MPAPSNHRLDVRVYDTSVSIWEEWSGPSDEAAREAAFERTEQAFFAAREHLEGRGWVFQTDPMMEGIIQAHDAHDKIRGNKAQRAAIREGRKLSHERTRQRYLVGRKGDLELKADTGGRTAKIEFFQNVANVAPGRGCYEFRKLRTMPRDLRIRCVVEVVSVARLWEGLGYTIDPKITRGGLALPLGILRQGEGREHEGLSPLERYLDRAWPGETGWPKVQPYDARDADGAIMQQGDVRLLYHRGRLVRGRVYCMAGNCWSFYTEAGSWITQEWHGSFFSSDRPDLLPRRKRLDRAAQAERLQKELEKATRAKNWKRVRALGGALERLGAANAPGRAA